MKNLSFIFATVLFFTGVTVANAADSNKATHTVGIAISKIALVDIEATTGTINITLNPTAPTEAGLGLSFAGATNSNLWLNYTSIVASGKTRNITASVASDLPAGISLKLNASNAATSGKGTLGASQITSGQVLTSSESNVITGIGSCYTGDGASAGSNLTYTAVVDDSKYSTIVEGSYSATVTYTITGDN